MTVDLQTTQKSSKKYRIFGLTIASNFPFSYTLSFSTAQHTDLTLTCSSETPFQWQVEDHQPIYTSPFKLANGENFLKVYRLDRAEVAHFSGVADFYIRGNGIICYLLPSGTYLEAEKYFLGAVLALWLEQQHIPVLHASAVQIDHSQATAFLSHSGGGKSTLAATMLAAGHVLLTDDILPVQKKDDSYWVYPGHPEIRLLPAEYALFKNTLRTVGPDGSGLEKKRLSALEAPIPEWYEQPSQLKCIFILKRDKKQSIVCMQSVSKRDAVLELLRYSFAARLVDAIGLSSSIRLTFFADIAQHIPIRRLIYPENHACLPAVRQAVLKELDQLNTKDKFA